MEKPEQWMKLQKLRDELHRTRPPRRPRIWIASLPAANFRRWVRMRTVISPFSRSRLLRFVLERQWTLVPQGSSRVSPTTMSCSVTSVTSATRIPRTGPRRGDGLYRRLLPGGGTRPDHIDHRLHVHDDPLIVLFVDLPMVV